MFDKIRYLFSDPKAKLKGVSSFQQPFAPLEFTYKNKFFVDLQKEIKTKEREAYSGGLREDFNQFLVNKSIEYKNHKTDPKELSDNRLFGEYMEEITERFEADCTVNGYVDLKKLVFFIRSGLEHQKDLVKGKDIVLFLGQTGSGKSTAIHTVAGIEMIRKQIKQEKIENNRTITRDCEVIEGKTKLEGFDIGHNLMSETRWVRVVEIKNDNKYKNLPSIIACDTPGYGENRGFEFEISNAIGICYTINNCRSFVPILLVKYTSMLDNRTGFNGVAKTVQDFFGGTEILDKIPIWFTHATEKKWEKIKQIISNTIYLNSENRSEKNELLLEVLTKIDTLIKSNSDLVRVFDPVEESKDHKKLINYLDNRTYLRDHSILKYKPIDEAIVSLSVCIGEVKDKTDKWLSNEKYGRVCMELMVLHELNVYIKEKYLENPIQEMRDKFEFSLLEKINRLRLSLNDCIYKNPINSSLIAEVDGTLQTLKYISNNFVILSFSKDIHPLSFCEWFIGFSKNCEKELTILIEQDCPDFNYVNTCFKNLQIMQTFPTFEKSRSPFVPVFDQMVSLLSKRLYRLAELIKTSDAFKMVDQFGIWFSYLFKSQDLSLVIYSIKFKDIIEESCKQFEKHLSNKFSFLEKIIMKSNIDGSSAHTVDSQYLVFERYLKITPIKKRFEDPINFHRNNIKRAVENRAEMILKNITETCPSSKNFQRYQADIVSVDFLLKLRITDTSFQKNTTISLKKVIQEKLDEWEKEFNANFQNIFDKLFESKWLDIYFNKIITESTEKFCLGLMKEACQSFNSLIVSYKAQKYDGVITHIKNIENLSQSKDKMSKFEFKIEKRYTIDTENEMKICSNVQYSQMNKNVMEEIKDDCFVFLIFNCSRICKSIEVEFDGQTDFMKNNNFSVKGILPDFDKIVKKDLISKSQILSHWNHLESMKPLCKILKLEERILELQKKMKEHITERSLFFQNHFSSNISYLKTIYEKFAIEIEHVKKMQVDIKVKKKNATDKMKKTQEDSLTVIVVSSKSMEKLSNIKMEGENFFFKVFAYIIPSNKNDNTNSIKLLIEEVFLILQKKLKRSEFKFYLRILKRLHENKLTACVKNFEVEFLLAKENSGANRKIEEMKNFFENEEFEKIPDLLISIRDTNLETMKTAMKKLEKLCAYYSEDIIQNILRFGVIPEEWKKVKGKIQKFSEIQQYLESFFTSGSFDFVKAMQNIEMNIKNKFEQYFLGLKNDIENVQNLQERENTFKTLNQIICECQSGQDQLISLDSLEKIRKEEREIYPKNMELVVMRYMGIFQIVDNTFINDPSNNNVNTAPTLTYNITSINIKSIIVILEYYTNYQSFHSQIISLILKLISDFSNYLVEVNSMDDISNLQKTFVEISTHFNEIANRNMHQSFEESKKQIMINLRSLSTEIKIYFFDRCGYDESKFALILEIQKMEEVERSLVLEIEKDIDLMIERIDKFTPDQCKQIIDDFNILPVVFEKFGRTCNSFKQLGKSSFFRTHEGRLKEYQNHLERIEEKISKFFFEVSSNILQEMQSPKMLRCEYQLENCVDIGRMNIKMKIKYQQFLDQIASIVNSNIEESQKYLMGHFYKALEEKLHFLIKIKPIIDSFKNVIKFNKDFEEMIYDICSQIKKNTEIIRDHYANKEAELLTAHFEKIKDIPVIGSIVPEIKKEFEESILYFEKEINQKKQEIIQQLSNTLSDKMVRDENTEMILTMINKEINLVQSVEHCCRAHNRNLQFVSKEIINVLDKIVNDRAEKIRKLNDINQISEGLVDLQFIQSFINFVEIQKVIDNVLNYLISKQDVKDSYVYLLGKEIGSKDSTFADELVSSHKQFKSVSIEAFTQKTSHHDFKYAIEYLEENVNNTKVKLTEPMRNSLEKSFNFYNSFFFQFFEEYMKSTSNKQEVIDGLGDIFDLFLKKEGSIDKINQNNWNVSVLERIPEIVARIFVTWSFQNSDMDFFVNGKDKKNAIMKPHSVQVISIFRILGVHNLVYNKSDKPIDNKRPPIQRIMDLIYSGKNSINGKNVLENHLIEIGTGEGKSITLAVTAIVFALFGYEVNVICYSKYLSERDYEGFEKLFKTFSPLIDKNGGSIVYSTIKEFCEDFVNESGDIREHVNKFMAGRHSISNFVPKNKRMMLIDEVDVFFSKDFYGNTYNPLSLISSNNITQLIEQIFENNFNLSQIKQSELYKTILPTFYNYEWILDTEIAKMLEEKKDYRTPMYQVDEKTKMIGYQEFDGITTSISYGYKTQFAYIKEKKHVSKEAYKEHIGIRILCGKFSYVEIAKKYNVIMGVSGTLSALTSTQKEILNIFKITKFSYAPSMFQKCKLDFIPDKNFQVIDDEYNQFQQIAYSITDNIKVGRAVLVFFENQDVLLKFQNSSYFKGLNSNFSVITPLTSVKDKKMFIAKATRSGSVTLLTREFGRGIDFLCIDKKTIEAGGVHVIQTFFSEDISEETQIKGRTARQEQKGSYTLLITRNFTNNLNQEELEKDLRNKRFSDILTTLEKERSQKFEKDTKNLHIKTNEILPINNKSFQLKDNIFTNKNNHTSRIQIVREVLIALNPPVVSSFHIIFVLDCSGSMDTVVKGRHGDEKRWNSLVGAVASFLGYRLLQYSMDIVSIIEFDSKAHLQCEQQPLSINLLNKLVFHGGGTSFAAGLNMAKNVIDKQTKLNDFYPPILLFLSDGESSDGMNEMKNLYNSYSGKGLQVFTLGFCGNNQQLQQLANAGHGSFLNSVDGIELESNFTKIAHEITIGQHK